MRLTVRLREQASEIVCLERLVSLSSNRKVGRASHCQSCRLPALPTLASTPLTSWLRSVPFTRQPGHHPPCAAISKSWPLGFFPKPGQQSLEAIWRCTLRCPRCEMATMPSSLVNLFSRQYQTLLFPSWPHGSPARGGAPGRTLHTRGAGYIISYVMRVSGTHLLLATRVLSFSHSGRRL